MQEYYLSITFLSQSDKVTPIFTESIGQLSIDEMQQFKSMIDEGSKSVCAYFKDITFGTHCPHGVKLSFPKENRYGGVKVTQNTVGCLPTMGCGKRWGVYLRESTSTSLVAELKNRKYELNDLPDHLISLWYLCCELADKIRNDRTQVTDNKHKTMPKNQEDLIVAKNNLISTHGFPNKSTNNDGWISSSEQSELENVKTNCLGVRRNRSLKLPEDESGNTFGFCHLSKKYWISNQNNAWYSAEPLH